MMKQQLRQELERVRKAPRARGSKSVKRTENYYELEQAYATKKTIAEGAQKRLNLEVKTRRLGNKIIQIQALHKAFGEKVIVDDFSYMFKSGERVGIIGKNGVGKSTFQNMLL